MFSLFVLPVKQTLFLRIVLSEAFASVSFQVLMNDMGLPEAGAWPARSTSRMVWVTVVTMLTYCPITVIVWQFWASGQEGEVRGLLNPFSASILRLHMFQLGKNVPVNFSKTSGWA